MTTCAVLLQVPFDISPKNHQQLYIQYFLKYSKRSYLLCYLSCIDQAREKRENSVWHL